MVLLEIFVQNVDDRLNWYPVMIKLGTGTGSLIKETGHPFLSLPWPHVVHIMFLFDI